MVMVDVDAQMVAAIYISGLTDQVGWLGLGVGGHPALSLQNSAFIK